MDRGLYNAASSMIVRLQQVDMLAHNLANTATPGFRAVRHSVSSFRQTLSSAAQERDDTVAALPVGVRIDERRVDLGSGPIRPTGNTLDVAIDGRAFLAVGTPEGVRYTRKGSLAVDGAGTLVTSEGSPVLDDGGNPMTVTGHGEVAISGDGQVSVGQTDLGRLGLFEFATGADLRSVGRSYYVGTNPQPSTQSQVRQGYLEESNVEPVTELVGMINALRSYESSARAMRAAEDATQALVEATRA